MADEKKKLTISEKIDAGFNQEIIDLMSITHESDDKYISMWKSMRGGAGHYDNSKILHSLRLEFPQ